MLLSLAGHSPPGAVEDLWAAVSDFGAGNCRIGVLSAADAPSRPLAQTPIEQYLQRSKMDSTR